MSTKFSTKVFLLMFSILFLVLAIKLPFKETKKLLTSFLILLLHISSAYNHRQQMNKAVLTKM